MITTIWNYCSVIILLVLNVLFPPPSDGNWRKWHYAMLDPIAPTNLHMDEYYRNQNQNKNKRPRFLKILISMMLLGIIAFIALTYWWYYV